MQPPSRRLARAITGDGECRTKERLTSSHTVLIALTQHGVPGKASKNLIPPTARQSREYDDSAVDVLLPRGFALVFEQSLLHTGLAVTHGTKYILQTGLLRGEPPPGRPVRNSTFKQISHRSLEGPVPPRSR